MDWRAILLLGIGANLDNLGVGISYGIRRVRVGAAANLLIAGIALAVTAAALFLGHHAAALLPHVAAKHIGAGLLFAVGLWVGLEAWLERLDEQLGQEPRRLLRLSLGVPGLWLEVLRDPQKADVDRSGVIDLREAGALGFALSLNNMATGLGGGLSHYPVVATAVVTALGSWLTIAAGEWLGRRARLPWLGRVAGYVAMLLLVGLALWEWSA